jgi:hypothetical protein
MSYSPVSIQVFFPEKHEAVAVRLAGFLFTHLGELMSGLHANTTYREILQLSREAGCLLAPHYTWGWAEHTHFLKFSEDDTFRDIVQSVYDHKHAKV